MAKTNQGTTRKTFKWLIKQASYQINSTLQTIREYRATTHKYKLVSIEKNKNGEYEATVQITNTKSFIHIKPEEILANNTLTDSFSQRDIRALTYLGYLGINSPKYTVLAKKLCQDDKKFIFAVQEKGKKDVLIKTAEELSAPEIVQDLDRKDAHMIGYTVGEEKHQIEKIQKRQLREANKLKNKQKDECSE